MSDFKVGDRVRVVRIKWMYPTPEELAIIDSEGTVVPPLPGGVFVRVELDEKPAWWTESYAIPFVEDELEKL